MNNLENPIVPYIFTEKEWEKVYSREEYAKKTPHVLTHLLHYLLGLNQPDRIILPYINKKLGENKINALKPLYEQDNDEHHGLTPLIIATMRGRIEVIKALLSFGHRFPEMKIAVNMKDRYGWTPLAHASLCSQEIFTLLVNNGASIAEKTPFEGTPRDLQNLARKNIKPLHLDRIFFQDSTSGTVQALSLMGLKCLCDETRLTEYREIPFVPPSKYQGFWQGNIIKNDEDQDLFLKYFGEQLNTAYPSLVIGKNAQLQKGSSFEVRAHEKISFGTIITEYSGILTTKGELGYQTVEEWYGNIKKKTDEYLFSPVDATSVGNVSRWINSGWPNCQTISMNVQGLCRIYFIAFEQDGILPGEPILFDYGINHFGGLFSPYTIFGVEKMREYFRKGLKYLLQENKELVEKCRINKKITKEDFLQDASQITKFIYPLNAPAALLDLHFNGIVLAKEWLFHLEKMDVKQDILPFIEQWKRKCGWMTEFVTSVAYRIEELEKILRKYPQKREVAIQWILRSIGSLSVVDILKGMDVIKEHIESKQWLEIQQFINNTLEGYDWTEDPEAPLGIKRRAFDMAAVYGKCYGKNALKKALEVKEIFQKKFSNAPCIQMTVTDKIIEVLQNKNPPRNIKR